MAAIPVPVDDKENPLREDGRLLGGRLGEVIREQAGAEALERIERIRQVAVTFRKETTSQAELDRLLNALNLDQTMDVVRAFSFFSHLLNIAEDEQQHRRRRAYAVAGSPRRPGSLSHALDEVRDVGFGKLMAWFARAHVSPVLTAHPTEVQRQSILECEREIARLIAQPAGGERDQAIHAEVLRLWLTSMLRTTKLQVADEVTTGINFSRLTFLQELPRLYAEFEHALKERFALEELPWLPPFLTVGSWIGGDRDGNPNVSADVLRTAQGLHARLLFAHYLEEVNLLGRELGLSARLSNVPAQVHALAERSADLSPHRQDEPYRRAISGIYARLAASAHAPAEGAVDPGGGGRRQAPLRPARGAALRDLALRIGVRSAGGRRAAARGGIAQAGRRGAARDRHRAAVRIDRRPRQLRRGDERRPRAAVVQDVDHRPRRRARGDAGVFRQQQGRRLRHLELGALQGVRGAARRVPAARRAGAPVPWARRHHRPRRRAELRGGAGAAAGNGRRRAAAHRASRG